MENPSVCLFPTPKSCVQGGGSLPLPGSLRLTIDPAVQADFDRRHIDLSALLSPLAPVRTDGTCAVTIANAEDIPAEGFRLRVAEAGIAVDCGDAAGAYYALRALLQIARQCAGSALPCLAIADAPALPVRGVLVDIGRNKIPKMRTLYALVERLADMRINHLELYMDGYSFDWKAYRYLFTNETPITAEEIRLLDNYARQRFVDLVPNQNCLGHMDPWLAQPPMRRFAECEQGFLFQGLYHRQPGTIDPSDPEAVSFVLRLLDELTENFGSGYVNVNLDEPFELGKGKNSARVAREGVAPLYMEYVRRLAQHCRAQGKRMLMWGDVVFSSPDCIEELPEDVILLDWLYEGDGDFAAHAEAMAATGRSFLLCPGSSSWCSFTGRSDNMRRNIANALDCAVRFGGKGIVLTDWGDLGHWQYLSVSYLPYAHAAGMAWSGNRFDEDALYAYCDRDIYGDPNGQAARLAWALGDYGRYEHAPLYNTTLCFAVMASKYRFDSIEEFHQKMEILRALSRHIAQGMGRTLPDAEIHLDAEGLRAYLADCATRVDGLHLTGAEADPIRQEMRMGIRMALHGLSLYQAMSLYASEPARFSQEMRALAGDLADILPRHHALWSARNRQGGYAASQAQLLHLMDFYQRHA